MPVRGRLTLAAGAALLALPAFLLTPTSFQPLERRADLQGREAAWAFELDTPESLFVEGEFTVRSAGRDRADVVVVLNGVEVERVRPPTLYIQHRAMIRLPLAAVRAGGNLLEVRLDGPADATFLVHARLHNYYGISPRFPRAVLVSDEAIADSAARSGPIRRGLLFATFLAAGLGLAAAIVWLARTMTHRVSVLLAAASLLPWIVVVYSAATPLHVWMPITSLASLVAVPMFVAAIGWWVGRHRRPLARAAAIAAITLVLLEAGLRAFNYVVPSPVFHTGSYERFRGRPGARFLGSRLNSSGFHDAERAQSKPNGTYRVVAVGDSVAFGVVPWPANFLSLLEADLRRDRPAEVVNLGIPGTGPADYLALLVREGLGYSPDLVIVTFFIGNDLEAPSRRAYERSYAGTLFYFLWRLATSGSPVLSGLVSEAAVYDDEAATFSLERFMEIEVERAWVFDAAASIDAAVARVVASVAEMRRVTDHAGARLLVVLAPDEAQVSAALQDQIAGARGVGGGTLDFVRPSRQLLGALTAAGVPVLDLLPDFVREGEGRRLYKLRDTHWNLAGNRLAADLIADHLRERGGW